MDESQANGWGLDVSHRNYNLTTTRLGVHLTTNKILRSSTSLSADLAWDYYLSELNNKVNVQFEEFGSPYVVDWTKLNSNSFDYAFTLSTVFSNCIEGYIRGSGQYWDHANIFNIVAGIDYRW